MNSQSPDKAKPSIEQIMRFHRLSIQLYISEHGLGTEEIEELNRLDILTQGYDSLEILHDAYAQLQKDALELVKALEFYADIDSWSTMGNSPTTYDRLEYDKDLGEGDYYTGDTNDQAVSGLRAREALAKWESR